MILTTQQNKTAPLLLASIEETAIKEKGNIIDRVAFFLNVTLKEKLSKNVVLFRQKIILLMTFIATSTDSGVRILLHNPDPATLHSDETLTCHLAFFIRHELDELENIGELRSLRLNAISQALFLLHILGQHINLAGQIHSIRNDFFSAIMSITRKPEEFKNCIEPALKLASLYTNQAVVE